MARSEPLTVLAVCGVGMGTSLILRMTAEGALSSLGVPAKVENTDVSTARGMTADVVIGQGMHVGELQDMAPVVLTVDDFLDQDGLASSLREALTTQGWI
ncbi:PTS sugar transporter subunit IIB [Spiractinospora alimapuensis]|uniref:PTS sugar transporter subunit IIB n=1 Tax=Spiractinospora alimapuensis TaxID=2820884 RepID=UPI001F24CD3A|nr:PTS sugar transporter subunit IIB [Spiractinospora alimapuensis]QVQ51840.1 PTS sugar transporter subunit IIB [Spiractinospora alimapuensis]